jgi:hypothetical protein
MGMDGDVGGLCEGLCKRSVVYVKVEVMGMDVV